MKHLPFTPLVLHIRLRPPQVRLPRIVLSLIVRLLIPIPGSSRHPRPHRPRNPIRRTTNIVLELSGRLLSLALVVLLPPLVGKILVANKITGELLAGAEGLVQLAFGAVGVGGGYAGGGDVEGAGGGAGFGEVAFGVGRAVAVGRRLLVVGITWREY